MKWFHNVTSAQRFILAFIIVSAVVVAVGFVSIKALGTIDADTEGMYQKGSMGASYQKEADIYSTLSRMLVLAITVAGIFLISRAMGESVRDCRGGAAKFTGTNMNLTQETKETSTKDERESCPVLQGHMATYGQKK